MHRLRHRYGRAGHAERAFSVEIRWLGFTTVYEVVHAKTDAGASKAAMHCGMRAAVRLHRGRPDAVIVHADAGTKSQHMNRMRGTR